MKTKNTLVIFFVIFSLNCFAGGTFRFDLKLKGHSFFCNGAIACKDGDFLLVGQMDTIVGLNAQTTPELDDFDNQLKRACVMRVDSTGKIKWSKEFFNPEEGSEFTAIVAAPSNTFFLLKSNFLHSGTYMYNGFHILQMNDKGVVLYDREFYSSSDYWVQEFSLSASGDFYVAGTYDTYGTFCVCIDSTGKEKWKHEERQTIYNGFGAGQGVLFLAGFARGDTDYVVSALEAETGNKKWTKHISVWGDFKMEAIDFEIAVMKDNSAVLYSYNVVGRKYAMHYFWFDAAGTKKADKNFFVSDDFVMNSSAVSNNKVVFSGNDGNSNTAYYGVADPAGKLISSGNQTGCDANFAYSYLMPDKRLLMWSNNFKGFVTVMMVQPDYAGH